MALVAADFILRKSTPVFFVAASIVTCAYRLPCGSGGSIGQSSPSALCQGVLVQILGLLETVPEFVFRCGMEGSLLCPEL
jgi:hypothetical protein